MATVILKIEGVVDDKHLARIVDQINEEAYVSDIDVVQATMPNHWRD